jgi:hypothetical protein
MPLFRCLNEDCSESYDGPPQFDFEADLPVCPKCKKDGRKHPQAVIERATIHYLANDDDGPIRTPHGSRLVACQPALRRLPKHATGETAAVTCPACKASAIFRDHVGGNVDQHVAILPVRMEP